MLVKCSQAPATPSAKLLSVVRNISGEEASKAIHQNSQVAALVTPSNLVTCKRLFNSEIAVAESVGS